MERHGPRLYTTAARLLGSADDAADAVQDALVRAWLGLPRFRGESRFSTWLHRILLNAVDDQRRMTPREAELPEGDVEQTRDRLAEHELRTELQRALSDLDEGYRIPLLLYDVAGCSYSEISDLLSIPEGTVKSRLYRGRSELARRLGQP